jgi:predicted negative regulator of RcsB-dependent stress response
MKKGLKIIGIILGVIVLIIGIIGFIGWRKMQKFNLVQEQANYIMENLDKPNIGEKFPVKYFPKAAELVYRRADASLPMMGMLSYDKKAETAIKKTDVGIAKNCLNMGNAQSTNSCRNL